MTEELYSKLRDIKLATDEILSNAQSGTKPGVWDVNWSDLRCIDVEYVASLYSANGYRVRISEASPDAWEFVEWLSVELYNRGHGGVDVVTEW